MSQACTWDWQAIAGFAGAASVLWAAWLAKSTIDQFRQQRYADRQIHVAEEAFATAAHLAAALLRLRANPVLQVFFEHLLEHPDKHALESYEAMATSTVAELTTLEKQAEELQRLSFRCDLLHGQGIGNACREIAGSVTKVTAAHRSFPPMVKLLTLDDEAYGKKVEFLSRVKPYIDHAFEQPGGDEFGEKLRANLQQIDNTLGSIVRAEKLQPSETRR